jgi:hypothetical protein
MWVTYNNTRTVVTLQGAVRLKLKIRRCVNEDCQWYGKSLRPEAEGAYALPKSEIGMDVIALIGALRYQAHRSIPEIHAQMRSREVDLSERSMTNGLYRYEELLSLRLTDARELRKKLRKQGRVILALDGLQPDVGHEVLWILRDVLSGEVLMARALLGSGEDELVPLIREVQAALGEAAPIGGVVSDGQQSIRNAVAAVLPGVPHQLCQFHFLREAGRPVYEADRHAKVALKKEVRGIRPIERALEADDSPEAEAVRDYCIAVRSALTDEGRPPLEASGLKLAARLQAVEASTRRVLDAHPHSAAHAPKRGKHLDKKGVH